MVYDANVMWSSPEDTTSVSGGGEYEFDLTVTIRGRSVPGEGTFRWHSTMPHTASTWSLSGYADVLDQPFSDATGDMCIVAQGSTASDCQTEEDEADTITGDAIGTLSWDGSTSCDACAAATVEGAEVGPYCREYASPYYL